MSKFTSMRLAQLGILPGVARIAFAILLAAPVLGQTVESLPAFEAATVKLDTGATPIYKEGPGQLEIRNYPLIIVIFKAFGIGPSSLSGPEWLGSVKVDIVAKLPASAAGLSPNDTAIKIRPMLQRLLAERFKLAVHREDRVISGYALVVAPGGLKMRPVERTKAGAVMPGGITGQTTTGQIAASAGGALDRPVRDMTGLSGYYEVNLKWTPEAALLAGADNTSTAPEDRPPSIFTALQELGLKLEPRNFPLQVVVVDHIERAPTEN